MMIDFISLKEPKPKDDGKDDRPIPENDKQKVSAKTADATFRTAEVRRSLRRVEKEEEEEFHVEVNFSTYMYSVINF